MKDIILPVLPFQKDLETKDILKKSISANRALAELKAMAYTIPNKDILLKILTIQEAKDSNEIENIITTHDDIYKEELNLTNTTPESKEISKYKKALLAGIKLIDNNVLSINNIITIQNIVKNNDAGIRKQPGTKIKEENTNKIIYEPPQEHSYIRKLLFNLESYINKPNTIDPLINMAIIHYQFEVIHPFYDGNGRTGRIINILYLILKGILDSPVLYLSNYIIKNKKQYYRLLQTTRTKDNFEEWILYMLDGLEQTAKQTTKLIKAINSMMEQQKNEIKTQLPSIYSKDLLEVMFSYPYMKISFLIKELDVTRQTASHYLHQLEHINLIKSKKSGREKYFVNTQFFELLKKGM